MPNTMEFNQNHEQLNQLVSLKEGSQIENTFEAIEQTERKPSASTVNEVNTEDCLRLITQLHESLSQLFSQKKELCAQEKFCSEVFTTTTNLLSQLVDPLSKNTLSEKSIRRSVEEFHKQFPPLPPPPAPAPPPPSCLGSKKGPLINLKPKQNETQTHNEKNLKNEENLKSLNDNTPVAKHIVNTINNLVEKGVILRTVPAEEKCNRQSVQQLSLEKPGSEAKKPQDLPIPESSEMALDSPETSFDVSLPSMDTSLRSSCSTSSLESSTALFPKETQNTCSENLGDSGKIKPSAYNDSIPGKQPEWQGSKTTSPIPPPRSILGSPQNSDVSLLSMDTSSRSSYSTSSVSDKIKLFSPAPSVHTKRAKGQGGKTPPNLPPKPSKLSQPPEKKNFSPS